ncbi:hypothetical protein G6L37_02005 [Agrobacterium rubi]|nr:hypothetical protein [Agrobacterium rubi]NTF24167.1 hypothetical protein [Agrobacterium rubi]
MTPPRVRALIGFTFLLLGIALIPVMLRSTSITISESSRWKIVVWLVLSACFTFWLWKFTEALIAAGSYGKEVVSRLIDRIREWI